MSALEEAIARVHHGPKRHYECFPSCPRCALDRAKEEVDRLVEMLTEVRATIQSPSRLAERIDAALAPFQPGRGAVKP